MRAIKDHAGDTMPSVIIPDLDMMTLTRALKFVLGYCNKHLECKDGCKLWDADEGRCLMRTDDPPCDWEPIIEAAAEKNEVRE